MKLLGLNSGLMKYIQYKITMLLFSIFFQENTKNLKNEKEHNDFSDVFSMSVIACKWLLAGTMRL